MGYAFMLCSCYYCHKSFTCNPMKVPSVKDKDGVKQPICGVCVARWNELRVNAGMCPIPPLSGAYEACEENELIF